LKSGILQIFCDRGKKSLRGPGLSGICGAKDFGKRAKNPIKSQHLFDFGIYHWMAAGGGESFLIFFDLELKICLFFSALLLVPAN
jgi:hypothetical protein